MPSVAAVGGDFPQPLLLPNHICTVPVPLKAQNSPLTAHWTPGGGGIEQPPLDDELLDEELELLEDELLDEELELLDELEELLLDDELEEDELLELLLEDELELELLLEDELLDEELELLEELEELEELLLEELEEELLLEVPPLPVQVGPAKLPSWVPVNPKEVLWPGCSACQLQQLVKVHVG